MAKEDIFLKLNLKDYNNELEKVSEEKNFSSDVRNLLLSMVYKIEVGYEDYSKVKTENKTKKEFVEEFIGKIEKNCEEITLVKPSFDRGVKYEIFPREKKIVTYANEKNVMEAICKLTNEEVLVNEKYEIIKNILSSFLRIGNNLNLVEVIRDFNGWSWTTLTQEIEFIWENLLYQDLRLIVGNTFLEEWISNKEYIMDYIELWKNKMEEEFGNQETRNYIRSFIKTLILVGVNRMPEEAQKIEDERKELEEEVEEIKDKSKYLKRLSDKKKQEWKKIEQIDEILSSRELLEKEFLKRNENTEEEIFSIGQLEKILVREKMDSMQRRQELQAKMDPKRFVKKKEELEEKLKFLKELGEKTVEEENEALQILQMNLFLKRLQKIQNKKELLEFIYQIRYYYFIPVSLKKKVKDVEEWKEKRRQLEEEIIEKALQMKLMNSFGTKEENWELIAPIFYMRVIEIENLEIEFQKEKEEYKVLYYDGEEIEKTKKVVGKETRKWKFNKRIEIFN